MTIPVEAVQWLIALIAVGTIVCVLGEVLRLRRLRLMSERLDTLSAAHDTGVRRRDSHEIRLADHERELGDLKTAQQVGLAEVLDRTRLHRRLLDHTRARLDVHGRAIGVQCVFEDLPPLPPREGRAPTPGCNDCRVIGELCGLCEQRVPPDVRVALRPEVLR